MYNISTQINGVRKKSTQEWKTGNIVKVGFLSLRILDKEKSNLAYYSAEQSRGLPDHYILESLDGKKLYKFTPHFGLEKLN
jgi:hypothetical protein